jgi:uncharacterized protein with HEPN domain
MVFDAVIRNFEIIGEEDENAMWSSEENAHFTRFDFYPGTI